MSRPYPGSYRAVVIDDNDPMQQQRLHLIVPEIYGDTTVWAVASRTDSSGTLPAIGEEVWVFFDRGRDDPVWSREPGPEYEGDPTDAEGLVGTYRAVVISNEDPMGDGRL